MDKKLKMSLGLGGPSIIMIFVILCLTTLGILSLTTANADWKLTTKNANFLTSYYDADSEVETWLADVDATLKSGKKLDSNTLSIPVSSLQDLVVVIEVNGTNYKVVSQKLVPNNQWNYEEYQNKFSDILLN